MRRTGLPRRPSIFRMHLRSLRPQSSGRNNRRIRGRYRSLPPHSPLHGDLPRPLWYPCRSSDRVLYQSTRHTLVFCSPDHPFRTAVPQKIPQGHSRQIPAGNDNRSAHSRSIHGPSLSHGTLPPRMFHQAGSLLFLQPCSGS